jgi:hypothetical protein
MPSPFPGMDPYLEESPHWPSFQHQLVGCLYQMLLPGLVDRYRARVQQRTYCTEMALFTSIVREQHHEELIEIRQRTDNRLITLIEVPSPINKTRKEGRDSYHSTRNQSRQQHASIVEIDLVLQGEPLLEYSRDGLPEWDYAITVTRSTAPERFEIYTATLNKRLPRFKVPLASDDRDTIIDLQAAFVRCFDLGNFGTAIDYAKDPEIKLTETRLQTIDLVLKASRTR